MGAFRLGDLVGIDVGNFTNITYEKAFGERNYKSQLNSLLIENKRLGW